MHCQNPIKSLHSISPQAKQPLPVLVFIPIFQCNSKANTTDVTLNMAIIKKQQYNKTIKTSEELLDIDVDKFKR